MLKVICLFFCVAAVLLLLMVLYICIKAHFSIKNLKRVDEKGTLYYADYVGNYYDPLLSLPFRLFRGGGCSAFIARDENGGVITGRNFDLPHKDAEGRVTGLNVVLNLHPKGGYKSLNIADAAFISYLKLPYYAGMLDGKVTKTPLILLPYLSMDGMNEKGLCVSILALDTKTGEAPVLQNDSGKKPVTINQLLRLILDRCADISEAYRLAQGYNLVNIFNYDYHLFLTDSSGLSCVFEWRYNSLTVTYTDISTNFYNGYDDACDCYYGESLKERFAAPKDFKKEYHYGYGHGYSRFASLAESIDRISFDGGPAVMTTDTAFGLLKSVVQEYDPESLTSFTQYSALYHNSGLAVDVCPSGDFSKKFHFEMK